MATVYQKFFNASCSNFKKQLEKKMKSSNTIKNDGEPLYKTVVFPEVSNLIFGYNLGKHFDPSSERLLEATDKASHLFCLVTLKRVLEFFSIDSIFRVHPKGDWSLITPWYCLTEGYTLTEGDLSHTFCADWLMIPVRTAKLMSSKVLCFVPCSGLEDNDMEAWWVKDISLEELGIFASPRSLKEHKYNGEKEVTFKKGDDSAYIPDEIKLTDGDFIKVRNQWYEVLGVASLREKHGYVYIRFTRQFVGDANNPSLYWAKKTLVKGRLLWVENKYLKTYNALNVQLTKIDSDGFGTLELKYQNAVFNKLGFLCYDCVV